MNRRVRIEVRGIVQGVGFRPYIYRLATRLSLGGSILNSEAGVSIEIEGAGKDVDSFLTALPLEAPPLARVLEIITTELPLLRNDSGFVILESTRSDHASTLISPDIATCSECVLEMRDSGNRRYLYPFINCTNCGPRFTIVRSVPYDRKQTSMAAFAMCVRCQTEYDNPLDRRFHAQPNACWDCGPQAELVDGTGTRQAGNPIAEAIRHLQQGAILAVKGLGGFHLAADARQSEAVRELRRRKGRGDKPFAVMVADVDAARQLCDVTDDEAALLESPQRPIVLVSKASTDFDALAPDGHQLGVFLPYTPLHHLLLSGGLTALVMTSGNLSEEPIAIDNEEALARLSGIADLFLVHNRDILLRCDDSVLASISGKPQFIRRSRAFVPSPIVLTGAVPPILAVGGELKNTICISRGRYAFPGQHVGDLESMSAYGFFQESIRNFQEILEVQPQIVAHDLHPGYLATQWAMRQQHMRTVGVQHHHAHIASCMAENQLTGQVIGIALDGTGYGTDGAVWGGEVLIADLKRFERAAHLAYAPLPGSTQAILEPWRMAVSHLWQTFGDDWRRQLPSSLLLKLPEGRVKIIEQMLRSKINAPLTSSCGRLFDAVAALVCQRMYVTYEAQAAIALEACCDPRTDLGAYPFEILEDQRLQIDARPLFQAIAEDLRRGTASGIMSRRFHDGLADVLAEVAAHVSWRTGILRVCLSGGVFLNSALSEGLQSRLTKAGFGVFTQSQVPPGDGGLSLGQLVIAANQS